MQRRIECNLIPGVLAVAGLATVAPATIVDLANNTSGTINGATYERFAVHPAGTGVFQPFVRIQRNDTEQGYNTSGRPPAFDEKTDPNFTIDVLLSDVPIRNFGGPDFYEFLLDSNEPIGGDNDLISLDQVKIFTTTTPGQTTPNVDSLGTLRYSMDTGTDSWVIINDALNRGSGESDMRLLVPVSNFAGHGANDFVILYSQFGTHNASGDGFEEWGVQTAHNIVPLPVAGAMGLAGLLGIAVRRPRR
jgi:hypothetical protein